MADTHHAIHPGIILAEELYATRMDTAQLAQALHVTMHQLEQLIQGRDKITAHVAELFGHYFGTGPELWLDLQTSYDHNLG